MAIKLFLLLFTILYLAGCTSISNKYNITGNSNSFKCDSNMAAPKTIDTTFEAAASQSGAAGVTR